MHQLQCDTGGDETVRWPRSTGGSNGVIHRVLNSRGEWNYSRVNWGNWVMKREPES